MRNAFIPILRAQSPPIIPPSLKSSCYAWWDARKTSLADATKWLDHSGNGRDMTLTNFAGTTADGWNAGSPAFLQTDRVDSYGALVAAGINAVNTSLSLVMAFKIPAFGTAERMLYTGNSDGITCYVGTTGYLFAYFSDSVSGSLETGQTITAATWYQIALVYDQSDKKGRVYLNGALIDTSDVLTTGIRAVDRINLGKRNTDVYGSFQTVYLGVFPAKALTVDEVKLIHNTNCSYLGLSKV